MPSPAPPQCDVERHRNIANPRGGQFFGLGLIVAVGVEGELAEEFSGGWVDDADVEVVDDGLADVLGNRRSQRVRC